jgi:hypothetical protein
MAVTSVAIPPFATGHWLAGLALHRRVVRSAPDRDPFD